ncbi:accessory gene regulator ArgB-like protein [Paenibacillus campi]|uniref:accessory gene regulator ArgB-like protein n=1 Tax=Paenibacillus campi TaxID=3106031 RepID=UPI002AFE6375|nr:accessory gene regulator B family protein [Paenibacillus sp. SGZ-1014]
MISATSNRIANQLKRYDSDGRYDVEVLQWQIGIYLNYAATIVLTGIFAWLLNDLLAAVLSMLAFIFIRKFSGGVHLKSLTLCAFISAGIFTVIPLISIDNKTGLLINLLNCFIFIWKAPNIFEELNKSLIDPYRKIISFAIVASNLVIGSQVLALTFLVQAVLILPFWRGGESYEKRDR